LKIENNKLIFIAAIINKAAREMDQPGLISAMPEEFFLTLAGQEEICLLDLNRQELEDIQLFIFYARLIGGLEISLIKKDNLFYFVNINANYEKQSKPENENSYYPVFYREFTERAVKNYRESGNSSSLKEKLLNGLPGKEHNCKIRSLVILTHDRPSDLEKALGEYIGNFSEFGHTGINIIVSDDSNHLFAEKNQEIVSRFKLNFPGITYLGPREKKEIIEKINTPENSRNFLNYIFGGENFPPSFGRNRNFSAFYLKEEAFITVDDDCRPRVLTYEREVVKKAIGKMAEQGITDLAKLEEFIDKPLDAPTAFLKVDFTGYFENAAPMILRYVKYSGAEDGDLASYLLNSLNLVEPGDRKNFPEINKKILFINKQWEPKLQGLCCFFPAGPGNFRLTLPEDIRVEDAITGLNYLAETGTSPLSSNIALYHEKTGDISGITPKLVHLDLISMVFYYVYRHLVFQQLAGKENIFNYINNDLEIKGTFWQEYHKETGIILQNLKQAAELAISKNETVKAEKIRIIIEGLEKEIFSLPRVEYEKKLEKFINNILKNYLNCLKLWNQLS
jgi:hypothetical protein